MACPDETRLLAWVQRGADTDETDPVEEHLDACPDCRRLLAHLARLDTGAAGSEHPTLVSPEDTAPREREPAGLQPGQAVGRYLVVERLGAGAMGVVYLARDPELDRKVALKIIRGELAAGERGERLQQRLSLEARAMARLDHPNVVAVHDVGTASGLLFVAMDYVEGGTLREWLLSAPRSLEEILDAFLAAARGLSAAHSAGLVHRDFKPDNVLVGSDGRVRVTDFGLARSAASAEEPGAFGSPAEDMGASVPGAIVGTPAYMAPEQMRTGALDARADVFSFCTALYEALYGQRPFAGRTLSELCFRIEAGKVEKPPPGTKVPWYLRRELLRGLRARPEERHPSMQALLSALERLRRRRQLRVRFLAAGLALVACAAAALLWRAQVLASGADHRIRRSLAVLPPLDRGARPETAWLSPALAEMLASELGRGGELRVARGEEVAQAASDLGLAGFRALAAPALAQLRLRLGADLIVSGAYAVAARSGRGGRVRLDLELWDALSGQRIAAGSEEGDEEALAELLARAGARLRREVRVAPVAPAQPAEIDAWFPLQPEAARAYAEGLLRLRAFDAVAARENLSRAAALAPDNARVHAALAQALGELGYERLALQAAQRAFELSGGLGREERLGIEALLREQQKDWPRAVAIDRALVTFFPDNLEHGLRLARALTAGSKGAEALAAVRELRKLPPPAGEDPRLDLAEADAFDSLGQMREKLAAAKRASLAGAARGSRRILADGKLREGWALFVMKSPASANEALSAAAAAYRAAGDRRGEAVARNALAIEKAEAGDTSRAREELEAVRAIYLELGNAYGVAGASSNLAILLRRARDLPGARAQLEAAQATWRELGDPDSEAINLHNLANLHRDGGDLAGAKALAERALAIRKAIGSKRGQASSLEQLGTLSLLRGELARAQGHFAEARARAVEAGDRRIEADIRWGEARVLLAQGKPREAEQQAREASATLLAVKHTNDAIGSLITVVWALLDQGKLAEARRAFDPPDPGQDGGSRQAVVGCRALLDGLAGDRPAEAKSALAGLLVEAKKTGFVETAFELRLALGLVELANGSGEPARAELHKLAAEARARGFELLARRATAAAP